MKQDEIIEMARQAGFIGNVDIAVKELEAFAKLVEDAAFVRWAAQTKQAVQEEREACALICDKEVEEWKYDADVVDAAIAIRARGEA